MKRNVKILAGLMLTAALLSGCGHTHQWQEAACESPKTCVDCGETEGEALGHTWVEATCETPQTCTTCGKTQGEALGHTWQETTCEEPALCTVCGETGEAALGHVVYAVPVENTETGKISCTGTCRVCKQENCSIEYEDWETLALNWGVGEWKFSECMILANFNTFVPEEMVGDGFVLREDGTAEFTFEGKTDQGKWGYLTTKGQITTVWCYFESTEGAVCQFCFSPAEELGWYSSDHTMVMKYKKVS